MGKKILKKCIILGMVSCILTGCGNAIPELTEEEASLVATYAADAVLQYSTEKTSRLIDTEKEGARREELEAKAAEISAKLKAEEEKKAEEKQSGASGSGNSGNAGSGTAGMQGAESIASFIGLDNFEVGYAGYEIAQSYPPAGSNEWEPTIDATAGKNLLVVKFAVANQGNMTAVADVLSENVMFHIDGTTGTGETIGGTALMTMLLNDFAFAQDEIEAGESREYILMIQIDEAITDITSLSMYMKKGEEGMTVKLL